MLFNKQLSVKQLDCYVDVTHIPTINSAKLIYVQGKGTLATSSYSVPDPIYGNRYLSQIMLNDIPLIQINAPGCPTCSSLIATGHGIENANCPELQNIRERINSPFVSLEKSIEDLSPLLTLLNSGLYLIAGAVCYPTDGNGNFFWNIPNQPIENPATADVLLPDVDYYHVSGHPIYLYPTQSTDCYNESRVAHYTELMKEQPNAPRAVVYNFTEFINLVLDGHHKACAAALLHKPLNCIVIIPYSWTSYKQTNGKMSPEAICFSSVAVPIESVPKKYVISLPPQQKQAPAFSMSAGTVNHRKWEDPYIRSVNNYPSLTEYATIIAADIPFDTPLSDELVERYLAEPNSENQLNLTAILYIMSLKKDPRLKETAISCIIKLPQSSTAVMAYRLLSSMRGDADIEQLFVDYLVSCNDEHDKILPIINSYWD